MKSVQKIDLGLTGYDELFMNDAERREATLPKIYNIPLSEIDDFPDHPFQVRLDEDMDQLVESVKERGVITPITLRRKTDGRYEIVSGHRRRKACELAGLAAVPAEIKELTRDEAIILMVESNLPLCYQHDFGREFFVRLAVIPQYVVAAHVVNHYKIAACSYTDKYKNLPINRFNSAFRIDFATRSAGGVYVQYMPFNTFKDGNPANFKMLSVGWTL